MNGWIKLHRSIKAHWVYDNPEYFKAWITMLMEVNHQDKMVLIANDLIDCPRGSSLNSLQTWVNILGKEWTMRKIRTFFELLEKDGMIDKQGLSKTTRLSICNYDTYQSIRQTDDTQSDKQTTNKRQTNDNKQEGEELKKGKERRSDIKEILEYLNQKAGKKFRTSKGLGARLNEGYTLDDCKKVVDIKYKEWSDNEAMCKFIRPETLFGNKFDSYLNQKKEITYKDLPFNEYGQVYIDKEKSIIYNIDGGVSSEWYWDSKLNAVAML